MRTTPLMVGAVRHRQAGLSLIELMVSLTIGLMILGALGAAYIGSRGAYRTSENLARVQETGRFALDQMATDVRLAGFFGCQSRTIKPGDIRMLARPPILSNAGGGLTFQGGADAIIGYEAGGGWNNPTTLARQAGDVLVIRRGSTGGEVNADVDIPNSSFRVPNEIGTTFRRGDYVALGTCSTVAILRVTNDPTTASSAAGTTIEHRHSVAGGGFNPVQDGNGTIGNPDSIRLLGMGSLSLGDRPMAFRFGEIHYFIANNPAGRRSLYRASLAGDAEELAENVEDMDVLYGIDDGGDWYADRYLRASDVATADWSRIVAVRVSLLVVGSDDGAGTNASQYALRDTNNDGVADFQTAADTRLRHVFSSTISLRNRSL